MKQIPIRNAALESHLASIAADGTDLYLVADGAARLAIVHATHLVNLMRANHLLGAPATLLLGQAYILALLAASTFKDHERIAIIVDTDGAIPGLVAEADSVGRVRGYLRDNEIAVPTTGSLLDQFGAGTIGLQRTNLDDGRTFQGQIEWSRGSLAENVGRYYSTSEQTATLLDVSVHFDDAGVVIGAGGIIAQALPGADHRLLDEIGALTAHLRPLGATFASGATAADAVQRHLAPLAPSFVGSRAAEFWCGCSHERFARFLQALPSTEREEILVEGPFPLRTTCHNCNSTYSFDRDELTRLFGASAEGGTPASPA